MPNPVELTVVSVGTDHVGKVVVRAMTKDVPVGARQRVDVEIPTDTVTFAKLAALGVRVYNDKLQKRR